jgi:hydrogenase small subunit
MRQADAAAVIAIGSCASWGGMPATDPNPTGASGVARSSPKPVVTIPGCPPNPYNFLSTVVHFLTFGKLPEIDALGRPKFAYSRLIHENCERRAHFDAGRFAMEFGDDGHRKGYCLYKLGCKGPETYANCPTILFGDAGGGYLAGGLRPPLHRLYRAGRRLQKPIHMVSKLKNIEPPQQYPRIVEEKGTGATLGRQPYLLQLPVLRPVHGAMVATNLGLSHKAEQAEEAKKASEMRKSRSDMSNRRNFLKGCLAASGAAVAATAVTHQGRSARDATTAARGSRSAL